MKKHGIEKNQMKKRFGQKCRRVLATRCTYWIPDAPTPAAFERFNVCAYEKRCSRSCIFSFSRRAVRYTRLTLYNKRRESDETQLHQDWRHRKLGVNKLSRKEWGLAPALFLCYTETTIILK